MCPQHPFGHKLPTMYFITTMNIFFSVPSENKKDVRSIEQTLADIQSKKRQKVSHTPTPDTTE